MKKYLSLLLLIVAFACEPKKQSGNAQIEQPVKEQPTPTPTPLPTPTPVVVPVEEEEVDLDTVKQAPAEIPVVTQQAENLVLQKPPVPKPEIPKAPNVPYVRGNLRSDLSFKSPELPKGWRTQVYAPHGYNVVNLPGMGQMAKLELRATDVKKDVKAVRAEINTLQGPIENEERVGYLLYLPKQYWDNKDTKFTIITQFHNDRFPGEPSLSPPICLFVQDGLLQISVNYGSVKNPLQRRYVIGKIEDYVDRLLELYWYIKFMNNPTTDKTNPNCGTILLSINGKRVLEHRGPTKYQGHKENPYFKVGIYKRKFVVGTTRIMYVGRIRQGNAKSTWQDVSPNVKL